MTPLATSSIENVSVKIVDHGSPWRLTLVRRMSLSPEAQRPMTYHGVWSPVL